MLSRLRTFARLLETAVRHFYHDNCTAAAAALAFYGLFSGFPLLLLAVTVSSLVLDPDAAAHRVQEVLVEFVPIGSSLVERAIAGAVDQGGVATGVSLLALLWSGSRVFGHLTHALDVAWDVAHDYPIKVRFLIEPLLVVFAVAVLTVGIIYPGVASGWWTALTGQPEMPVTPVGDAIGEVWGKGLGFLLILLLFRYLPRRRVRWVDALPGAALATVLFQVVQEGFEAYWRRFGSGYDEVYGPLASLAVLLLWAYLSSGVLLLGAQFSAAYAELVRGRPPRPEQTRLVDKVEQAAGG
jgi:membrane protein